MTDEPRLLSAEEQEAVENKVNEALEEMLATLNSCFAQGRNHIRALEAQAQADAELIAQLVEALAKQLFGAATTLQSTSHPQKASETRRAADALLSASTALHDKDVALRLCVEAGEQVEREIKNSSAAVLDTITAHQFHAALAAGREELGEENK